jgi:hypothetical protein
MVVWRDARMTLDGIVRRELAQDNCIQTSFRIFDEVYRSFQYLIFADCDALNGWPGDDVGNNADALGGAVIGIEHAQKKAFTYRQKRGTARPDKLFILLWKEILNER